MKRVLKFLLCFVLVCACAISFSACELNEDKEIDVQVKDGELQWKYEDETKWKDLVEVEDILEDIKGDLGEKGETGDAGKNAYIHVRYAFKKPTSNSDMFIKENDYCSWIGICANNTESDPENYTDYSWIRLSMIDIEEIFKDAYYSVFENISALKAVNDWAVSYRITGYSTTVYKSSGEHGGTKNVDYVCKIGSDNICTQSKNEVFGDISADDGVYTEYLTASKTDTDSATGYIRYYEGNTLSNTVTVTNGEIKNLATKLKFQWTVSDFCVAGVEDDCAVFVPTANFRARMTQQGYGNAEIKFYLKGTKIVKLVTSSVPCDEYRLESVNYNFAYDNISNINIINNDGTLLQN